MFYWAPSQKSDVEVDFLLARRKDLLAIEVNSGNTFQESWCKGLRAVPQLQGLRCRIIVYSQCPVLQTEDGIEVLPFRHFADLLADQSL